MSFCTQKFKKSDFKEVKQKVCFFTAVPREKKGTLPLCMASIDRRFVDACLFSQFLSTLWIWQALISFFLLFSLFAWGWRGVWSSVFISTKPWHLTELWMSNSCLWGAARQWGAAVCLLQCLMFTIKCLHSGLQRPFEVRYTGPSNMNVIPCWGRTAFVIRKLKLIYCVLTCTAGMWHWDLLQENWSIGKHLQTPSRGGGEETEDTTHMAVGASWKCTPHSMFMLS